jgi:hypothetical protein
MRSKPYERNGDLLVLLVYDILVQIQQRRFVSLGSQSIYQHILKYPSRGRSFLRT